MSGLTCSVAINGARAVKATFNLQSFTLSVVKRGLGGRAVTSTSTPATTTQISCGPTCSSSYSWGTKVTLTATPDVEELFLRWRGCDKVSGLDCTVFLGATRSVIAIFSSAPQRWPRRGPITPITSLRGTF